MSAIRSRRRTAVASSSSSGKDTATHGCRSVAFSLGVNGIPDFRAACAVAPRVVAWALDMPAPFTLNVNVPSGGGSAPSGGQPAPAKP